MAKYIELDALVAEIERRKKAIIDDNGTMSLKQNFRGFKNGDIFLL